MLKYFRHHSLRKSLWLIVLLASLMTQSQNLFACDLMENGAQTTCCCGDDMSNGCPMGGGCETSSNGKMSGCCDTSVVIEAGLEDLTLGDSSQNKQLLSLDTPQPLVLIILIKQLVFQLQDTHHVTNKNLILAESTLGTATYQLTNRFRI